MLAVETLESKFQYDEQFASLNAMITEIKTACRSSVDILDEVLNMDLLDSGLIQLERTLQPIKELRDSFNKSDWILRVMFLLVHLRPFTSI